MAKQIYGRDRNGRMVRFDVDDAAEAVLRREGREQVMELTDRIDPEPSHEQVTMRQKDLKSTYRELQTSTRSIAVPSGLRRRYVHRARTVFLKASG